jgi:16S rRNA (uracil1498-N3)-methyltransferase
MHRFHLPPDQCRQHVLTLSAREAHHALHVLRLREGERVVVLDGAGTEFLCEVQDANAREVTLQVRQRQAIPPSACQVTLLQAVPKGKTMDLIVQKATELGVHRIVPILSERVVTQLDSEAGASKAEKWQGAAVEAIKQCGSAWLPAVEVPVTPQAFLARGERFELLLIASLQPEALHPRECFDAFFAEKGRPPKTVGVWVGPEGDFTPAEVNLARAAGALPITLGPRVLRSDTAAVYCLSVINYELQSPRP